MFWRRGTIVFICTALLSIVMPPSSAEVPGIPVAAREAHTADLRGNWQERPDWERYFSASGVTGTILLYDLRADQYYSYHAKRANTRYTPASTFKVLNSLIALELGTIKDADEIIAWDGVDRGIPAWNQDQSMRQAFHNSTIWFYQELARRAGEKRIREYLNLVGYGNQNPGGGVDRFWLDGKLRISAREQIDFLVALQQDRLPFSRRSTDSFKELFISDQTDSYTLRSKTGWARCFDFMVGCQEEMFDPQLGWAIGYLERDGNAYFFALNIDIEKPEDAAARMGVVKSVLRDLQLVE